MNTKEVQCFQCGKKFLRAIGAANEAEKKGSKQFCSKECIATHKTSRVLVPCTSCGELVSITKGTLSKSKSHNFFCDKSCAATFNNKGRVLSQDSLKLRSESLLAYHKGQGRESVQRVCRFCGTLFKVLKSRSSHGQGLYCSRECTDLDRSGIPQYDKEGLVQELIKLFTESNFITSKLVNPSIYHQACKLFGSWNEALTAAGIPIMDSTKRGVKRLCLDGHGADSAEEAFLDNWLHSHGITHEVNKYYPGTTLTCDFYLPEFDLWVEYLGLYQVDSNYRNRYAKKKEIASKEGFTLVGVLASDLRKGVSGIEEALTLYLQERKGPREYLGRPPAQTLSMTCTFCGGSFQKLKRKHKMDVKRGQTNFFCCKAHQVKYQWEQRK